MTSRRKSVVYVCLLFGVFGSFIGTLAVSVAEIEKAVHISHGVFGMLLAGAVMAGAIATALVSVRAHKQGSGRTLREALFVWATALAITPFIPSGSLLAVAFVISLATAGAVDVVMNTMANEVMESHPTGVLRIHACYNFGAATGAAASAVAIINGWNWRIPWLLVGALCLALAARPWREFNKTATAHDDPSMTAALRSITSERLLIVALAFTLGTVVEGGAETWGPLYLRLDLDSGVTWSAVAAASGYLIGCATRVGMSFVASRIDAKWCAFGGALVSAAGLSTMVFSASTTLAVLGLAIAVGGITCNWPLLISYATRNSKSPSLVTGGMSTAGYAGLVIGPAILGQIASHFSLHASITTLLAFAITIAVTIGVLPARSAVASE